MGQQARNDGNRCKASDVYTFAVHLWIPTVFPRVFLRFSQGFLVLFSAGSYDIQVTSQIRGIIDGTITDFEDFDQKLALKERAKQIRQADLFRGWRG